LDLADIKEILRIVGEQGIAEFELEQDGVKLRVCKGAPAQVPVAAAPVTSGPSGLGAIPQAAPAGATSEAPPAEDAGCHVMKSPIVGTFYRSPDPSAPPFVNVGDHVRAGQVVCIVEAMKLMNEIEADEAGEIVKVHLANGQPVQYGDPLFTIRPA
jgi:acetyl-CoA carboxylase biotin carboxyl carrier protein